MQRIGQSLVPRHGGPKRRGSEGRRFFVFLQRKRGEGFQFKRFFFWGGEEVLFS